MAGRARRTVDEKRMVAGCGEGVLQAARLKLLGALPDVR
jgi:hypothetical protein